MTVGEKAVELARETIGVHESPPGSNWGWAIKVYLAFVGIFTPAPWCCAWALYKLWQATKAIGVPFVFPKTGSCSVLGAWASKTGRLFTTPPAYPCLFLVRLKDKRGLYVKGRYRHIGYMVDKQGHTIEGNSNNDGSAEGYEVVEHQRNPLSADFHYIQI